MFHYQHYAHYGCPLNLDNVYGEGMAAERALDRWRAEDGE
jgi:hypothetical protein